MPIQDRYDLRNLDDKLNLSGQVLRCGDESVKSGGFADIWEGLHEGEKVAVKVIREVGTSRSTLTRVRSSSLCTVGSGLLSHLERTGAFSALVTPNLAPELVVLLTRCRVQDVDRAAVPLFAGSVQRSSVLIAKAKRSAAAAGRGLPCVP